MLEAPSILEGSEEENNIVKDPGGAAALPHFEEVAQSLEEVKKFHIDFISEEVAPAGVVIKREERRARVLFLYPGEKRRSPITSSLGEALGGDKVQVVAVVHTRLTYMLGSVLAYSVV